MTRKRVKVRTAIPDGNRLVATTYDGKIIERVGDDHPIGEFHEVPVDKVIPAPHPAVRRKRRKR